jgi:hypothetical protein
MRLHRADVYEQIRSDGVFVHFSDAEAVDVHGKLYAAVGDSLYGGDGWHETEAAAREEAAAKVARMADLLADQAARIRRGGR